MARWRCCSPAAARWSPRAPIWFSLSIAAGVANAVLLPVVLGFLFFLARTALPEPLRLRGLYGAATAFAFLTVAGVGVGSAIAGWL